jgi:protein required for attachment to host cells
MTDLILVADRTAARLYRAEERDGARTLLTVGVLTHPAGRLRARQIASDRPGRVFARAQGGAGTPSARRGGTDGEADPREAELERYLRGLLAVVAAEQRRHKASVVLIAGPRLLGLMRTLMPPALAAAVTREIRKDYLHASDEALLAILRRREAVPSPRPVRAALERSSRRTIATRRRGGRGRQQDRRSVPG